MATRGKDGVIEAGEVAPDAAEALQAGFVSLEALAALAAARGGDEGLALVDLATCAKALPHKVPISDFTVGAAVKTEKGVYLGMNLEMDDLCLSMHGEQSALHHAFSEGARRPERIGITASPCGLCRQLLSETAAGGELEVACVGLRDVKMADLLPNAFSPALVGKHTLGSGPRYALHAVDAGEEPPALAAAKEACAGRSQACWTESPAGVALELKGGEVVSGVFLESVAHNPTVNPVVGAATKVLLKGHALADVTSITGAYAVSATVAHADAIRDRAAKIFGALPVEIRAYNARAEA